VPASNDGRIAFEIGVAGATPVPVRAKILSVGRSYRLLVGRDVRELTALDRTFERSAAWGIAVVLLLAFSGGVLMSLGARRRIASINRTARRIIAGNFSERVPDAGSRDEYDDLALNINAMLDQIESLFESVRHVGDSIAHDLKTPLTRLRNRLELLTTSASPGIEEIQRCVADSDRLLNTFNALLRISRIESGAYRAAFRLIDLGEIVSDTCDLYRASADERQISISIDVTGPSQINGDRELLAQAVANLLDNAVKYAPQGGRIDVIVTSDKGHCRIVVADNGDGVATTDLDRIAQRFVRLDSSRSAPGNGLGLSLVRAVVDQHRGRLVFEDNKPGLRVILELPRREPESK
jgi:signal transduction histidine kinase